MAKRKSPAPAAPPVNNRLVDWEKYEAARRKGVHPSLPRKCWKTFMGSFPRETLTTLGAAVLDYATDAVRDAIRRRGLKASCRVYRGANKAGMYLKWQAPCEEVVYDITLLADVLYERFGVTVTVERKTGRVYGPPGQQSGGVKYITLQLR